MIWYDAASAVQQHTWLQQWWWTLFAACIFVSQNAQFAPDWAAAAAAAAAPNIEIEQCAHAMSTLHEQVFTLLCLELKLRLDQLLGQLLGQLGVVVRRRGHPNRHRRLQTARKTPPGSEMTTEA
jgi:hypothetical protein